MVSVAVATGVAVFVTLGSGVIVSVAVGTGVAVFVTVGSGVTAVVTGEFSVEVSAGARALAELDFGVR